MLRDRVVDGSWILGGAPLLGRAEGEFCIFLLRRVRAGGVQKDSDGPLAQRVSNGAIGWFGWAARSA